MRAVEIVIGKNMLQHSGLVSSKVIHSASQKENKRLLVNRVGSVKEERYFSKMDDTVILWIIIHSYYSLQCSDTFGHNKY